MFPPTPTTKPRLSQDLNNTWHWDTEAGVNMRTLEESSPATAAKGAGVNGEEISVPSQLQTLPPGTRTSWRDKLFSLHFQELFNYLFIGGGWGGWGTYLLCFHHIFAFRSSLAAGKCNWSNSRYFSVFHTVAFLLLLVFFFSPFSFFLSQTRTNTVRLAENWQASTIQRQWFFF